MLNEARNRLSQFQSDLKAAGHRVAIMTMSLPSPI
jgi:hypothetical protein